MYSVLGTNFSQQKESGMAKPPDMRAPKEAEKLYVRCASWSTLLACALDVVCGWLTSLFHFF
jgi:hypothetical protein